MSNDKESVLTVARNEKLPSDAKAIIKDPMFLVSKHHVFSYYVYEFTYKYDENNKLIDYFLDGVLSKVEQWHAVKKLPISFTTD